MRIAVVSVAPLFPDLVIGGSQKVLADVVTGLKLAGHDVRVWCCATKAHFGDFEISGVVVHPELKLRGAFPSTHKVAPIDLAQTAKVLREAGDWCDRIYLHADAVYLRHALKDIDVIRSIHDYVYEEALISTLSLDAGATIVPSAYLKACIEATIAISGKETIERIFVAPNGVSVPNEIPIPRLPVSVSPRDEEDLILLFPHRPEPTKGVIEAFQVALEVQKLKPDKRVRLLMPAYSNGKVLDESVTVCQEIYALAEQYEASELVELHEWLPPNEMPGYLASGDATLCVGSFIESFGLIPVESIANGTPAICAQVGALRQFEGIEGAILVPYGDFQAAASAVIDITSQENDTCLSYGRLQIRDAFSEKSMIDAYEAVIVRGPIEQRRITMSSEDHLILAPWVYVNDQEIFNDYTSESRRYPKLTEILRTGSEIRCDRVHASESLEIEVRIALESGVLIPKYIID